MVPSKEDPDEEKLLRDLGSSKVSHVKGFLRAIQSQICRLKNDFLLRGSA